jgi:hypothetical protein
LSQRRNTDILLSSSCDSGKKSRRRITMRGLRAKRRGDPVWDGTGISPEEKAILSFKF